MKRKNTKLVHYIFLYLTVLITMVTKTSAQDMSYSGYLSDGITFVDIQVHDGFIEKITPRDPDIQTESKIFIAPGFIDTQVNGYASVSFNRTGLTEEGINKITKAMWKEGVTTFFPTIVTNSSELINKNLKILISALKNSEELLLSIPGFFLEGPYISPYDGFRGAHTKEWVRAPDWNEFSGFLEAAEGKIIQVGLAPEIEGAMHFIKNCHERGIVVSLAHHNGSPEQIEEAVELGASVSTHLGNGCANMIHRHNNPLWPQLANDKLTPSLIADGHHLRKEELQTFYKVKGADNLMLVSDATELAGMPAGTYEWNGKEVVMTEDGMLKYPAQNVLAGASFPIRTGIQNMMLLAGCSLEESIKMATSTPSRVYDLKDRGNLKEGLRADLTLFTLDEGEVIIEKTILKGRTVYQRGN
jgi:N-acetylglucosamine-6-phosphate deacetylase